MNLAQAISDEMVVTLALTPALSPWERENPAPFSEISRGWVRNVSLTPGFQPGVTRTEDLTNRFNGLSRAPKTVKTVEASLANVQHRAEATVLMRRPSA